MKGGLELVTHSPQRTGGDQHARGSLLDDYDLVIYPWKLPHIEATAAMLRIYVVVCEESVPAGEKACAQPYFGYHRPCMREDARQCCYHPDKQGYAYVISYLKL